MSQLRVLFQDENIVAIDKPAGFHVHSPEMIDVTVSKKFNCMKLLRDQVGCEVHPVHRIDFATSGVVVYTLSKSVLPALQKQFSEQQVSKTYYALVRGWVSEAGAYTDELDGKSCVTEYEPLKLLELEFQTKRYSTARYSLVRVNPKTGRTHQIRRHFAKNGHPLIGDTRYGDGAHNRYFKQTLGIRGLLLKAYLLKFSHPLTNENIVIRSRWNHTWHKLFDKVGACPIS